MAKDGYSGINSLANVLNRRMKGMGESAPLLDYATINKDMSLRPDTFPVNIPKKAYTVCRHLTLGDTGDEMAETTANGATPHSHKVKVPKKLRSLKPGDRVLIAWVGNDACVIDVIKSAN